MTTASTWFYAVLPALLVALGASGLLRQRGGRKLGPRLAEIGPVLGFLAGFIATVRGVPFLNGVTQGRLGETAVLALVITLGLALLPPGPRIGRYCAIGAALLAVFWQLPAGQLPAEDWLVAAAAGVVAVLILWQAASLARTGAASLLVLALASLGLAMVASAAHAGLLGAMGLALAASCAGWLVWARPWPKAKPGHAVVIGAGMVFAALAYAVFEGAARTPWALAPLLLCFWAEAIQGRVPILVRLGKKKPQRFWALTAAAAIPVAVAILLAVFLP